MPKTNGQSTSTPVSKTGNTKKSEGGRSAKASAPQEDKHPPTMGSEPIRPDSAASRFSQSAQAGDALAKRSDGTSNGSKTSAAGKDASAKEQLRSLADMGRERVATEARGVVSTLERVADAFEEGDQAWVGRYVSMASEKLDDLAQSIQDADASEFVDETRRYARREPWLFLGGCFVLGLAAGRVLRAGVSSGDASAEGPR